MASPTELLERLRQEKGKSKQEKLEDEAKRKLAAGEKLSEQEKQVLTYGAKAIGKRQSLKERFDRQKTQAEEGSAKDVESKKYELPEEAIDELKTAARQARKRKRELFEKLSEEYSNVAPKQDEVDLFGGDFSAEESLTPVNPEETKTKAEKKERSPWGESWSQINRQLEKARAEGRLDELSPSLRKALLQNREEALPGIKARREFDKAKLEEIEKEYGKLKNKEDETNVFDSVNSLDQDFIPFQDKKEQAEAPKAKSADYDIEEFLSTLKEDELEDALKNIEVKPITKGLGPTLDRKYTATEGKGPTLDRKYFSNPKGLGPTPDRKYTATEGIGPTLDRQYNAPDAVEPKEEVKPKTLSEAVSTARTPKAPPAKEAAPAPLSLAERIKGIESKRTEAKALREEQRKRADWGELASIVGRALTQIGAAQQGLKTGVDMSNVLGPALVDWDKKRDRIDDDYKQEIAELSAEQREITRLAEREEDKAAKKDYQEKQAELEKQKIAAMTEREKIKQAGKLASDNLRALATQNTAALEVQTKRTNDALKDSESQFKKLREIEGMIVGDADEAKIRQKAVELFGKDAIVEERKYLWDKKKGRKEIQEMLKGELNSTQSAIDSYKKQLELLQSGRAPTPAQPEAPAAKEDPEVRDYANEAFGGDYDRAFKFLKARGDI